MVSKDAELFKKVLWFDKHICDATFFAKIESQRNVSIHPRYKSGEYFSEKCKKEIQHESGLEERFFRRLEQMNKVLYYWHQPIRAPYWRGKIRTHTTPDVGIIFNDLRVVIVEVKPLRSMLDYKVQMKVEGLLKFCAQNGCGFLFTDGSHTLEDIRKVRCNRKLEREILRAIDGNVLREKQCKEILERCNATQKDLLKIIFKHGLKYKPFPFKLQYGIKNELFHQVFYEKKRYDDLLNERLAALFNKGEQSVLIID